MNIKTKYNIGDKVWYTDYLGATENSVVTGLEIYHGRKLKMIFYHLEKESNSRTKEQNLFPTKEALLKSL
jgi:hypothetical protein